MELYSKSATARKMIQKMSKVSLSQRCLRSHNTRTVLASKENKMGNPKCTPTSGKVSRRTRTHGSHHTDSGIDSQTLVPPNAKVAQVLGKIKNSKKIVNVGKRSTRTALKVYDYPEADSDTENRPEGMSKKKSQMEVMSASNAESATDSKRKRNIQTSSTIPLKRKSIIDSSYFLCNKKINHGIKRQNNAVETPKTKLKKKSVAADMSGTTAKVSVESNVSRYAETIIKNVERKCPSASENGSSDSNTKLVSGCLTNGKNLNTDLPKQSCSALIVPKMPAASLGISPIVAEAVIRCSMPSGQCDSADKICEDVSEAFISVSTYKQQEELDCSIRSSESDELPEEADHEPLHLGLTSTPEKSPSSAVPCDYSSPMYSGMDDIVEVTLYDSPEKLSPIKTVDPPESSLSDASCYLDDDFESPPQMTDDRTPIKNDVEETVMKSFRAYHTPHQFRRHFFKKSKKTLRKPKSKSPAEVKLDLWASVMNDHFEDIEGSELVIE